MAHNRDLSSFSTYEEYKKLNEEINREIDESIQKYDALRAEADKTKKPETKYFSPTKNK